MSKEEYQFPYFDNDEYIKEYKGNTNDEISKKQPIWDTILTNNEISAIHSAINMIGDKLDNTIEDEWSDEEEKIQHQQTIKYLSRITDRVYDKDGRYL